MLTDGSSLESVLKPLSIKELRVQCRARGLNPAGSREALMDRIIEHMMATKDGSLKTAEGGSGEYSEPNTPSEGTLNNNYFRPEGQNVGNFITDRPSSRVLAPPGGGSNIIFGGDSAPVAQQFARGPKEPVATSTKVFDAEADGRVPSNNYVRPGGQNVGNFLTDRASSRVLAPPGGGSSVMFG